MANKSDFQPPKANLLEEYDIIEFCEELNEEFCKGTVRKKPIASNATCAYPMISADIYDDVHDRISKRSRPDDTQADYLDPIMGAIDGHFEIQTVGRPVSCWTTSQAFTNTTISLSTDNEETPREKEFCHISCKAPSIRSEKNITARSLNTASKRKVAVDTNFNSGGTEPPKMPEISRPLCEKLHYIQTGICWIKHELRKLREVDQSLIETFRELISQSRRLKRVKDTFEEQQEILEEIDDLFEKEEFENLHLIDKSLPSDVRVGIERKVSNVDRYIRLGRVDRRASHY